MMLVLISILLLTCIPIVFGLDKASMHSPKCGVVLVFLILVVFGCVFELEMLLVLLKTFLIPHTPVCGLFRGGWDEAILRVVSGNFQDFLIKMIF